jgi:hypothetical protein
MGRAELCLKVMIGLSIHRPGEGRVTENPVLETSSEIP